MVARTADRSPQSEDRDKGRLRDGERDGTPPWTNAGGAVAATHAAAFAQRSRRSGRLRQQSRSAVDVRARAACCPKPGAPLIVLLHGCGQAAARFAADTGWIALADRLGMPLVLPEQSGENNQGRCFNWFRPLHVRRGFGEALSIRQMVDTAVARFDSDPQRVFVAGLSAGGAMAAALLAAYPDVFAGGAIVAGLPVGAANSATEALRRMAEAERAIHG